MIGQTPYRNSCLRIAPSIVNDIEDINITLEILESIVTFQKKGILNEKYTLYNG